MNNPLNNISDLSTVFGLILPKPHCWRLVSKPCTGEINGLPTLRGMSVATNGIHVALLNMQTVAFGHLEWFIKDRKETLTDLYSVAASARESAGIKCHIAALSAPAINFEEFFQP